MTLGEHAIVIGGSLAGLIVARVLARYFESVTIVERDRLPAGPEFRAGVPQSHHVHVLLRRGLLAMEQLFPGFAEELRASGAPSVDWAGDVLYYFFGGWKPRFRSDLVTWTSSRVNLEWIVRRHVANTPRIHIREGWEATDLLFDGRSARVIGVRTRPRDVPSAEGVADADLLGDLVVDASGRESRVPTWLRAHGYSLPRPTVVNSFLGYATRWYQPSDEVPRVWKGLLIAATPPASSHGGVILPVEDGRWMVTLAGAARDYPPTDEDGFLAFARSLPSSILYDAITTARPLTRIRGYRRTENCFWHFDRAARWPERLVVAGDAGCAFNPVYGQGMSVAALGGLALDRCLGQAHRRGAVGALAGLTREIQRELASVARGPWLLATGTDFRYPETEGDRPGPTAHLVHRYVDRVQISSTYSSRLHRRFLEVSHLLRSPASLFAPDIAVRVALGIVRGEAPRDGESDATSGASTSA